MEFVAALFGFTKFMILVAANTATVKRASRIIIVLRCNFTLNHLYSTPKLTGFFSALNQACNRVCVLLNKRFFLHFHSKWGSFFCMLLRFSCSVIYSNLFYFFIFQTIFSRFEVQKLNSQESYIYVYIYIIVCYRRFHFKEKCLYFVENVLKIIQRT